MGRIRQNKGEVGKVRGDERKINKKEWRGSWGNARRENRVKEGRMSRTIEKKFWNRKLGKVTQNEGGKSEEVKENHWKERMESEVGTKYGK